MAGQTVRETVRSLAKTHLNMYRSSPFHRQGDINQGLFPELERQLTAMEKTSANKKIQKAITPHFLRILALRGSSIVLNNAEDHAVDLIIGAFFFAMRSCKFVHTSTPGQAKIITLECVTFFTVYRKRIKHSHPHLIDIAMYVRITF